MFKKIVAFLHLWLGLISGLVVLVSLTAASIFVWEKELTEWIYRDAVYVPEVKPARLPFKVLLASAQNAVKQAPVGYVEIENDPKKAYEFSAYKESKLKGWTYQSATAFSYSIYVDPYTGKVTGIVDTKSDWISNMYPLHACLLLDYDTGHYMVGIATLIIIVMVITGIVLWWPKNKAAFRQRYWFRWKQSTKWRRKNYDIHNIGGIYAFLLILLFAATGLVWTFDWWENGIYRILGNVPEKVFKVTRAPQPFPIQQPEAYDMILKDGMARLASWEKLGMNIINTKPDSAQTVSCFVKYHTGTSGWDETNEYFYNSKTGKLYSRYLQQEMTLGAKWRYSNYAIHTGSIYGLPTKILAFVITLFCASLPVTGFLIWLGRKKKKKKYLC